jgi:cellulose synthase/poly-beta-1,6-N-acetylglucosamine synthase-like glycosyltransferase
MLLVITTVFLLLYALLIFYYFYYWLNVKEFSIDADSAISISIIIAARNEEEKLPD